MKSLVFIAFLGLLTSCGKEESRPPREATEAVKKAPAKPKALTVPQGKLPKMDPDKAKFIAAPSTPKDPPPKDPPKKK